MAKEKGRRVSADFLSALDYAIARKIEACLAVKNGGKVTLDEQVVHYVFGTGGKP